MRLIALTLAAFSGCVGDIDDLCSTRSGPLSEIAFLNRSDQVLEVNWLDEQCQVQRITNLAPHHYLNELSTVGHAWRLRVGNQVVYRGRTTASPSQVIYPAQDRSFCSDISRTEGAVGFFNQSLTERYELWWLDPACAEVKLGDLPPRSHLDQKSWLGHRFSVRLAGTQQVVKQVEVSEPADAGPTAVVVVPEGPAPFCSDEATSLAHVTFRNGSARRVSVSWVDYGCAEVAMGDLEPGQTLELDTFFTHAFRVKDAASGAVVLEPPRIAQAVVTVDVP